MIKLRRSIISDILGLTDERKETFEVNNKENYRNLVAKASAMWVNGTVDLFKNSDGTTSPVYNPSNEQIRNKFKDEIKALTKKNTFQLSMPVTIIYSNGNTAIETKTVSFDTFEDLQEFVCKKPNDSIHTIGFYPYIAPDPVKFTLNVFDGDYDGEIGKWLQRRNDKELHATDLYDIFP